MPNNDYGVNYLFYGTPVMTGCVLQSFDLGKTANVDFSAVNESGRRIYQRYDDVISDIGIEALVSGSIPLVGSVFTYNSTKYECYSTNLKGVNNGVQTFSLKGRNSENITLP